MNSNLFVGGFPFDATSADLEAHFRSCGTVKSVKILLDRDTGRSRGLGFIEMSSESEARAAIAKLHGSTMSARKIFVSEARPRENQPEAPAAKPGFVERRSGKDRRRAQGAPGAADARRTDDRAPREWKPGGKPDWKAGPKKEWKPGAKPDWKAGPKKEWKPGGKPDWKAGPKKEWKPGAKPDWNTGAKKEWKPAAKPDWKGGPKKEWKPAGPGGHFRKDKPRRDGGGFRGR
jgi:hypothetical protein